MSRTFYDIGDLVTLRAVFTVGGEPTDPDDVVFRVRRPSGVEEDTTEPESDDEGTWTTTYTPTESGTHWWRVSGTGDAQAAEESTFEVRRRRVRGDS